MSERYTLGALGVGLEPHISCCSACNAQRQAGTIQNSNNAFNYRPAIHRVCSFEQLDEWLWPWRMIAEGMFALQKINCHANNTNPPIAKSAFRKPSENKKPWTNCPGLMLYKYFLFYFITFSSGHIDTFCLQHICW
jgi:hypothetical protein